jgi:hypothetical protein
MGTGRIGEGADALRPYPLRRPVALSLSSLYFFTSMEWSFHLPSISAATMI